jgi:hypothetical protein
MLGAFAWLDDNRLLERIASYPYGCVVFTKQPRPFPPIKLSRLQKVLDRGRGFPVAALEGLEELMPLDDFGRPQIVGPYTPAPHHIFRPLRTLGYRKVGDRLVTLMHAKVMLLGQVTWHEDEEFGLGDIVRFQPRKLWIGSTNGTFSSRVNLEMGCWQTQPELFSSTQNFLARILASSEDLDPDADTMELDLAEQVYDDAAMAEAAALLDDDDYACRVIPAMPFLLLFSRCVPSQRIPADLDARGALPWHYRSVQLAKRIRSPCRPPASHDRRCTGTGAVTAQCPRTYTEYHDRAVECHRRSVTGWCHVALDRQAVKRLAFIRLLYTQGVEQAGRPQPLAATALLAFHDAVEMFLLLAAEYLGVSLSKGVTFDGYFGEIEKGSGTQLPLRPAMRRMNNSRVNFKHHGSIPSSIDQEQFRADVTTFFTDATEMVFSVDFTKVDMIDLVTQQTIVERLRAAEGYSTQGNYFRALALMSEAFDELLDDYADRKRGRSGSSAYSWWPPMSVRLPGPLRIRDHDRELLDRMRRIVAALSGMDRSIRVLAVGLDYRRYARFQLLVPPVINVKGDGDGRQYGMPVPGTGEDDYQFCREFVIETALHLAELDFDLDLKQIFRDHRKQVVEESETQKEK